MLVHYHHSHKKRGSEDPHSSFQSVGGGGIRPKVANPAKIYPAPKAVHTKIQYAMNNFFRILIIFFRNSSKSTCHCN